MEDRQDRTTPHNSLFTPPTPAELAPLFPQLEILELIGQGGMGAVYKARQTKLDRLVALKILPPEAGRDLAFAERFAREARALGCLSHPHVVGVHDFGEVNGLFYILMEYVSGVSLRQALADGPLKPSQALALVAEVCSALQYAHEEGVVHRDIKPENILLDRKGRVKIADFGLAKLLGRAPVGLTLTGSRQVMGTLHYLAPEQMERPQEVDHRADVYSLGVVFYEMLTGELPLGRFPPPSEKAGVDVRLDAIVLRALEKDPARRFQHASDVQMEVESFAAGASRSEATSPEEGVNQGDADLRMAAHQLRGPSTGLTIAGILSPLGWVVILLLSVWAERERPTYSPWYKYYSSDEFVWPCLALVFSTFLGGLLMAAARKMKRLEAYELAIIASCLAVLPLMTWAFLMSLPMGVWALLVLRKPEVRAAFASNLRRTSLGQPLPDPSRSNNRPFLRSLLTWFFNSPPAESRGKMDSAHALAPLPAGAGRSGVEAFTAERPAVQVDAGLTAAPEILVPHRPFWRSLVFWAVLVAVGIVLAVFAPWREFRLTGFVADEVFVRTSEATGAYVQVRPFVSYGFRSWQALAAAGVALGLGYVLVVTGAFRSAHRWHGGAMVAAGAAVVLLGVLFLNDRPPLAGEDWMIWDTGTRFAGKPMRGAAPERWIEEQSLRRETVNQYADDLQSSPRYGAYAALALGVELLLLGVPILHGSAAGSRKKSGPNVFASRASITMPTGE